MKTVIWLCDIFFTDYFGNWCSNLCVHMQEFILKNFVDCYERFYPHGQWASTVVNRLAQQTVSGQPGRGCELERQKLLSSLICFFLSHRRDFSSCFVKLALNGWNHFLFPWWTGGIHTVLLSAIEENFCPIIHVITDFWPFLAAGTMCDAWCRQSTTLTVVSVCIRRKLPPGKVQFSPFIGGY